MMCVYSASNISYQSIYIRRFWERVSKQGDDDCWEWTAGKQKDGYGAIRVTRKSDGRSVKVQSHRLSYMIHVGDIPESLIVIHSCDNPPCCNPKHLRLGDQHDNMQDKYSKGRSGQTPENISPLLNYWKGRKHSEETLSKMRESARRRWGAR
jgi:hypothetical protein